MSVDADEPAVEDRGDRDILRSMPRTRSPQRDHALVSTVPTESTRARRHRTAVVAVAAALIALLVAAIAVGVTAFTTPATDRAPAASITPPAPTPTPEPIAAIDTTTALGAQTGWLRTAGGTAPQGLVILFPDNGADPAALLADPVSAGLLSAGWAVATGTLGGASWGSPSSTGDLAALRDWVDGQIGPLPTTYVSYGMGAATSISAMFRDPARAVACWYAVAPISDLVTASFDDDAVAEQIAVAWGDVEPTIDDNPVSLAQSLSTAVQYRVLVPRDAGARTEDGDSLVSSLEASGHTVTSADAAQDGSTDLLTADVTAFVPQCLG